MPRTQKEKRDIKAARGALTPSRRRAFSDQMEEGARRSVSFALETLPAGRAKKATEGMASAAELLKIRIGQLSRDYASTRKAGHEIPGHAMATLREMRKRLREMGSE